jgi:hypothetical protein
VHRAAPQVEVRQATAAEVLPFVLLAGLGASRGQCEEIAAAGVPFIVTEDGTPAFGLVLEPCGPELVITAAGGRSQHFDLTRAGFALAELQGEGFRAIRFETRRRGLVRRAERLGYALIDKRESVYIMRKAIQ